MPNRPTTEQLPVAPHLPDGRTSPPALNPGAAPLPDAVFLAVAGMIEAVTVVDAASDEFFAAELQRGQCVGAEELLRLRADRAAPAREAGAAADVADQSTLQRLLSLTPNLKLIVRDETHASRRVTAKPEAADEHLAQLTRRLFTDKNSITQIIEHSDVWRRKWEFFVERQEDGSGGRVVNDVRAAQHRHESTTKPRGRFVLNLDAFLQTAVLIVADPHGQAVRRHAIAFLRDLTVEDAVQVAMLADAAHEALLFTRQLEDDAVDPGQLSAIGVVSDGPPRALPGGKVCGLGLHKPHVGAAAKPPELPTSSRATGPHVRRPRSHLR